MDTPVTVSSSTLSSVNKPFKKSAVPLSESSIVRLPVSWDSSTKPYDRGSSCTPTTLQKVNNWIRSLNRVNRGNVGSRPDFIEVNHGLDMEEDFLHGRMTSHFSKSELKEDKMIEDELNQYCRGTYSSYEKAKGSGSTSKILNETLSSGGLKKHSHPKAIKRRKPVLTTNLVEKEIDRTDDSDSDVPLSPESEKKKELCSYLQLMKPTDKKTVMILQNRRSVRVKNLGLMQEKRELDKKLRQENSEHANDHCLLDVANVHCLLDVANVHSFEEINMELQEKKHEWLRYSGVKESLSKSFHFPNPREDLKCIVADFDEAIQKDWFKDWKEQTNKMASNSPSNARVSKAKFHTIEEENKELHLIKTRHGSKRMGVGSQETTDNKKKVKSSEKEKSNSKVVNGMSNNEDKNGFKGNLKKNPKHNSNGSQKGNFQTTESEYDHFSMPKPSLHLATAIRDFGDVFPDTIKNNSMPFESKNAANENALSNFFKTKVCSAKKNNKLTPIYLAPGICDFGNLMQDSDSFIGDNSLCLEYTQSKSPLEIKNKVPATKKRNRKPPFRLEKGISDFTNVIQDKEVHVQDNSASVMNRKVGEGNKLIIANKTKASLRKKKNKIKKSKSMFFLRRNSSFKIKLVPKKKSSGLPSKGRRISDHLRSSQDDPRPKTMMTSSLKKKNHVIKKDNLKEKMLTPKTALKAINENTLKCNVVEPPVINVNQKVLDPVSQELAKLPITGHLLSVVPDVESKRLHKTRLLVKKRAHKRERSPPSTIMAIFKDQLNSTSDFDPNLLHTDPKLIEEKSQFYSQILNVEKGSDEDCTNEGIIENTLNVDTSSFLKNKGASQTTSLPPEEFSHSSKSTSVSKISSTPISSKEELPQVNTEPITFISFKKQSAVDPLHSCLSSPKQKVLTGNLEPEHSSTNWASGSPSHRPKKIQHSIHISKENGPVLKIFYMEYNLVLCQESLVSFWTQTALGHVLGAQDMWIQKGSVQRLSMNNNCIFKESLEMVVSTDMNVAYIELWTKEHQSDIREGPVADVFAIVYFWKKGHNKLDKKVLQLENINGFADDVQYSVLKSSPKIIVSWHLACNEMESKKTFIHCYQLSCNFQSVCNISEFEAVEHYVSSLHNIEGCDTLIMGCGENKITLWNIEHGYVAATIEMLEIKSPLSTLWVKCDRGFLFTLQQCVDRELRLIAIHGMNHSWKKLASYTPPEDYDRLKGVCVENGIVLAFYDQGIICWNARTTETLMEASQNEADYISGKYIISIANDELSLRHAITYLLSAEESSVI